ncbi:hypothetical protein PQX77_016227 [Marasmius sp. AFHP31]|nr:hypothetical protein PQX77_016227 [Marasmius sp. AFHP31]
MSTHFSNAHGWTIGTHANFQTVAGNSTTNIYSDSSLEREDRVTLHGRTVRKIIDGDINLQRVLSSEILSVNVKPEGTLTTHIVKVKKMEQTAKIFGYRGKFTVTSFEPVDEKDQEVFAQIKKVVLETAMCGRSALLKQVFAVAESENVMTLIAHDELANGLKFSDQYRGKEWIVLYYLDYTLHWMVNNSEKVTDRWNDWLFNVKSLTWSYDPASLCLNPPNETYLLPFIYPFSPLHQETLQQLNTAEIVAHVEEGFSDVLHLIASVGNRGVTDLLYYAQHGLLTFGTVVNRWKPKILAHLPSTPSPKWFCHSRNPNVKANYSGSGRVDFLFQKTGNVQLELDFGWRISEKDLSQLCCTFLCQSLCFVDNCADVTDVVIIAMVGFCLQGTFPFDPMSCLTPAYLFVKPLPTVFINNLHCVCHPFPKKLFYWASDPQGRNAIAEEDWERFGIPELSVTEWIGDYWEEKHYAVVREHLCSRSYDLDGKQYAHDHGHPELIFADPDDTTRIEEYAFLDPEPQICPPLLASPSNSSPLEAPAKSTTGQHKGIPMLDTHDLVATTFKANKHQRTGAGVAMEPCCILAEQQDCHYKNDKFSYRQASKEPNIQLISPLHRRDAFATASGIWIHPQCVTTVDSVNPTAALQQNFWVGPNTINSNNTLNSHSLPNPTGTVYAEPIFSGSYFPPNVALSGISDFTPTNLNHTLLTQTAANDISIISTPSSNYILFHNIPTGHSNEFAMHDRDILSVLYGSTRQEGTTALPFFHARNMQHIGTEPQHKMAVDSTLSQWNIWGSPVASNSNNASPSPSLLDPVNSVHMPQLVTTSFNHIPYTTINNSHNFMSSAISYPSMVLDALEPSEDASFVPYYSRGQVSQSSLQQPPMYLPHIPLDDGENQVPPSAFSSQYPAPSAISYLSMAQDTLEPSRNASFVSYHGGGQVPQSSQQPPMYWLHMPLEGGENQVPPSEFSTWDHNGGDRMEGVLFMNT